MKIIAWNCQMAFRKKADFILAQKPDIVVVPECERPDKLRFDVDMPRPADVFWHGENPNKGLGVFSYGAYKFELLDVHNPHFKNILPLSVTGGPVDFMLFAIWANNPQDKDGAYIAQIWKAVHWYDALIQDHKTILAGDFNSNTIWDKPKRAGNHSTLVERLEKRQIHSVYHRFHGQKQGQEAHPTWYLYRHQDKPHHLDYCFASADFMEKLQKVEVGAYEDWAHLSDHMPLIATFDL
jgi:exodeoxyribonuclease III